MLCIQNWWILSTPCSRKKNKKKQPLRFLVITFENEHRLSQLFHCEIPQEIFYRGFHLTFAVLLHYLAKSENPASSILVIQKQSLPFLVIFFIKWQSFAIKLKQIIFVHNLFILYKLECGPDAQRGGHPAEYRWHRLFNAAMYVYAACCVSAVNTWYVKSSSSDEWRLMISLSLHDSSYTAGFVCACWRHDVPSLCW